MIESATYRTGKAEVIQSHYKVDGLPEDMELQTLEPLRELFMDKMRKLGVELGLPKRVVYHHPFPGSFDDVVAQVKKKETVWLKNTKHVVGEFELESIGSNSVMRALHDEAIDALKSSAQGNAVTRWLSHLQEINRTVSNVPHNQMVDTDLLKAAWKAYRDKFKQTFIRHHGPNGEYIYARMIGDVHHMRLKSLNPDHMLKASNLFILPPVTERSMKLHLMLHYVISGGEGFSTTLPRMDR